MNPYRRRVLYEMEPILKGALDPGNRVLEVGAGDGWFAMSLENLGICNRVTAVDINTRPDSYHIVEIYDGEKLLFSDREFDLVYAVDVVHHADHFWAGASRNPIPGDAETREIVEERHGNKEPGDEKSPRTKVRPAKMAPPEKSHRVTDDPEEQHAKE